MRKSDVKNAILKKEKVRYVIKDEEVEVIEKYYINPENGERLYDRDISIENDITAYDAYKKKKGLLTTEEIKAIRRKYDLTQKEYALAIGVGEITVHRFENGTIQTESIDAIMRLSIDPNNMKNLIEQNKDKLSQEVINKTRIIITRMLNVARHKIANINFEEFNGLNFSTTDINTVADAIITEFNEKAELKEKALDTELAKITPLELQKYLYYVNGISLAIYKVPAFTNDIVAWTHGPVVEEIYYKYREYGRNGIDTPKSNCKISAGLKRIIEEVIKGYGKYTGGGLIELTHDEEPWKSTFHDDIISNEKIAQYFEEVYAGIK